MKERTLNRILNTIVGLPFNAVTLRIPHGTPFRVRTTESTKNFRKAQVRDSKVLIPTGASAVVDLPSEEIDIKDWREKGKSRQPGASIVIGDEKVNLNSGNNQIYTSSGVEIVYKRE